jgi:hypothetical protein
MALEPLAVAQPVSQGAVEGDVRGPGECCDKPRSSRPQAAGAEQDRAAEAVGRVVERHGAGMKLTAVEAGSDPDEERGVGQSRENDELPKPDVVSSNLEDRQPEERKPD